MKQINNTPPINACNTEGIVDAIILIIKQMFVDYLQIFVSGFRKYLQKKN